MVFLLIMVASWLGQSTWLKRELERACRWHFQESAFSRARFKRESFKREGVQERVLVFKLGFQTPPQWWSWPIRSYAGLWLLLCCSTQSINQHVMEFYILLQSILLDVISITRIWYIWQKITLKKCLKLELSNSYIPNMTLTLKA